MDKVFNRDFLFLVLLLVIIAGFFLWKNPEFASNLFSSPGLNLTENTGLDLGDINFKETEKIEKIEEVEKVVVEEEVVILTKTNILEPKIGQIYKEVNKIAQEVAEIEKQVKNLIALAKVQKVG